MTNEQWLVYLYSIYPTGGFQVFYAITGLATIILMLIFTSNYYECINKTYNPITDQKFTPETKAEYLTNTMYVKLGKLKYIIPITLLSLAVLCNLVPNKNAFIYIIATPYLVDGTKSAIDLLQDPTSKLYKVNQLLDKGLDRALQELSNQTKDNK